MLKRVYLDNYRCFVNFEYTPERKQLLIGANGSGKSSLLDALRCVKSFVAGDENPFIHSTRTRWQSQPLQIIEVDATLDSREYRYRLEVRVDAETRQQSVNLEKLEVDRSTTFEVAAGQLRFFLEGGTQQTAEAPDRIRSALHLSRLSNHHVGRFMRWLESLYCFQIDAYFDAMEDSAEDAADHPDFEMGNLAAWYRHLLQTAPAENARFLKALKSVFDSFQELRFYSSGSGAEQLRAVFMTTSGKSVNFSLSELSDGQRYLLALYMILHFLVAKGHTVFIDEPDNFIALPEIQPWLKEAEQAVEDEGGQLVLVSHHPEILNQWAARCGLRFFREDNGYVRTERFHTDPKGILQPSELIARGWEGA